MLIYPIYIDKLRVRFPEVDMGAADARAGKWREVPGDYESMAYEIGRMIAKSPPRSTSLGLLQFDPFTERAIRQLVAI
jgi:hypothetical protein